MVERLFHWLAGAKFMLWMRTAGVAWMGRAAASFTESSLQPQDGWAGGFCGHGQPLLLWESFGVRASPCDAQLSYLFLPFFFFFKFLTGFCFWLALAWPPLSDTFSHSLFAVSLLQLLLLLPLIFILFHFSPFSSFDFPVSLAFPSCCPTTHHIFPWR